MNQITIKKAMTKFIATITISVIVVTSLMICMIAASVLMAIYHGWAASILWEWFIVPLGMPSYTVMQMAGVQLIIGFLFVSVRENRLQKTKKQNARPIEADYWRSQLNMTIVPLAALASGWLLKYFM